jgi:predicted GTPase
MAAAPVRVLLAGQVNAGKSSLLNAMAQEVRCAVGPLPTTTDTTEHLLTVDERPAVVLVDMAGVGDSTAAADALAREVKRADLVLWVASAMQPARAPDKANPDRLRDWARAQLKRRSPPTLLALTHVDQLRPIAEWAPPLMTPLICNCRITVGGLTVILQGAAFCSRLATSLRLANRASSAAG